MGRCVSAPQRAQAGSSVSSVLCSCGVAAAHLREAGVLIRACQVPASGPVGLEGERSLEGDGRDGEGCALEEAAQPAPLNQRSEGCSCASGRLGIRLLLYADHVQRLSGDYGHSAAHSSCMGESEVRVAANCLKSLMCAQWVVRTLAALGKCSGLPCSPASELADHLRKWVCCLTVVTPKSLDMLYLS